MKKLIIIIAFFISLQTVAQSTPIPDINFEIYLINLGLDHGVANGSILNSDAEAVLNLNILLPTISDLTGLEAFKNLKTLSIVHYSGVTCPIYTMDSLNFLYIVGTTIPSLDVSNNLMLDQLTIEYTPITSLNVSANTQLKKLYLNHINIGQLDITNNTALEEFSAMHFSCDSIDFSQNTNLNSIGINSLGLDTIDLSLNTALLNLVYQDSAIYIDITNNINLRFLLLEYNLFSNIDLSQNTAIEYLLIGNNNLDSLKVSNLPNLKRLECDSNTIKKLDLRFNPLLEFLDCRSNNLSELNIKNGNNSSIANTMFNATNNPNLYCIEVDNVSYSYNNWTNKDSQSYYTTYCNYDLSVESEKESNILIFPNPINSQFKIKSTEQPIEIVITDLAGKKVFDSPYQSTYNIQHLNAGFYIVTVQFSNSYFNKKIQIK